MATRPFDILQDRRGIALPVAIFALVMIGTLVGGVFFTARLEMKGGESSLSAMRASEAAQGGLMVAVPNTVIWGANLTDGQSTTLTRAQIGSSGSYYTITITRLNRFIYLVRSLGQYEGRAGFVSAERTMAQLVKRYMPEVDVNSGAIVVGNANVTGNAHLNGNDTPPPGWTGCAAGPAQPGLRTNGTAGGNKLGNVSGAGTPAYTTGDTTVTNMSRIMDTLFFQLAGQANVSLTTTNPPNTAITYNANGSCKTSDPANWGDPDRASPAGKCETYFPIVYINGGGTGSEVRMQQVTGQGILLVNGDLKFNSGNHWAGLILVRGTAVGGNGTSDIDGTVMSLNVNLDEDATFSGTVNIDYSSCAVNQALGNVSVSAPTQYRGFMQF